MAISMASELLITIFLMINMEIAHDAMLGSGYFQCMWKGPWPISGSNMRFVLALLRRDINSLGFNTVRRHCTLDDTRRVMDAAAMHRTGRYEVGKSIDDAPQTLVIWMRNDL